jgi:acyl-coenzyme A thioesterase PaaI-like protein
MSNSIDMKALFQDPEMVSLFRDRSPAHSDLDADIQIDAKNQVVMEIPYKKRFSTFEQVSALHPGVVMTAMDSAMGLATIINLDEFSSLATLDLRYDQLKSAAEESPVRVVARFESLHDDVAYLTAHAEDSEGVFARATARFILTPASSGFIESAFEMLSESESSS